MIDLYIVTGFLGAGKTTFLKQFIPMLGGVRLSVIVNEFGQENVDEQLLKELNVALQGVSGGSIFCACRLDQFEKALSQAILEQPDAIIVETSGLSDPTGIHRVLRDRPEFQGIRYRGCVCVVDAARLHKLYETARVIKKQLSISDIVLLNKVDTVPEEQLWLDLNILEHYVKPEAIWKTRYAQVGPELEVALGRMQAGEYAEGRITADIGQHSLTVTIGREMAKESLCAFLERFAASTFRIKGFLMLKGEGVQVDCVGDEIRVVPASDAPFGENRLVVLYGYGQPAMKLVRAAAAVFAKDVLHIEAK